MTVPITIPVDATTLTYAGAALPLVQATVPGADLAYVWRGLARYGLNKLRHRLGTPDYAYTAGSFTPGVQGAANVDIELEDDDSARVDDILVLGGGITRENIASAAVCTGAAGLVGTISEKQTAGSPGGIIGPFSAAP